MAKKKSQSQSTKVLKEDNELLEKYGFIPDKEYMEWDTYFTDRFNELQDARENNIEEIWRNARDQYLIDEWEPKSGVKLEDWQSRIPYRASYKKVQTSIGLLVANEPNFFVRTVNERIPGARYLVRNTVENEFRETDGKAEISKLYFNTGLYGTGYIRVSYDYLDKKVTYIGESEPRTISEYDNVFLETLDNWNVYMDDGGVPNRIRSYRDVVYGSPTSWEVAKRKYPESEYPNMKYVQPYLDSIHRRKDDGRPENTTISGYNLFEWHYENKNKDIHIIALGTEDSWILISYKPLPQHDKQLSVTPMIWTIRETHVPYGVGIPEILEKNVEMMNRVRNSSIDELNLSINASGFFEGPSSQGDSVNYRVAPGQFFKKKPDSKVDFITRPPLRTRDISERENQLKIDMEDETGITRGVEGGGSENTAYQSSLNREASLQRLRVPLDNLRWTMRWTMEKYKDRVMQVARLPKVLRVNDKDEIINYLAELPKKNGLPDNRLYREFKDPETGKQVFDKVLYKTVDSKIERDGSGNIVESKDNNRFFFTPDVIDSFDGQIYIDVESMFSKNRELERQEMIQAWNLIMPMLQLPREIAEKPVREFLKRYNMNPQEWLPEEWLLTDEQRAEIEAERARTAPETGEEFMNAVGMGQPAQPGMGDVSRNIPKANSIIPQTALKVGAGDAIGSASAQNSRSARALGEAQRSLRK